MWGAGRVVRGKSASVKCGVTCKVRRAGWCSSSLCK